MSPAAVFTGGPAFPVVFDRDRGALGHQEAIGEVHSGMSLRDYFMAHAPADPQPWFAPAMPPRPALPDKRAELTEAQRSQLEGLGDYLDDADVDEAVRDFAERRRHAVYALEAWEFEQMKQRFVQWPAAWADEMLKARRP